jgi:hypothetical protein
MVVLTMFLPTAVLEMATMANELILSFQNVRVGRRRIDTV